jgi:hypothetical protein
MPTADNQLERPTVPDRITGSSRLVAARRGLLAVLVAAVALVTFGGRPLAGHTASAQAATIAHGTKVVAYRGLRLKVPVSWPVYKVSASSTTCLRFNRHAVYLGTPGTSQSCPVSAAGRTEAIAVAPLSGSAAATSIADPELLGGTSTQIVSKAHHVVVSATWNSDPSVIAQALGLTSVSALQSLASTSQSQLAADAHARFRSHANLAAYDTTSVGTTTTPALPVASTIGAVFNGEGFDACTAPSTKSMSDWLASPFRAVGVYIGGANMGCSQPNLTSSWVSTESAAGWHLIPIYVGLQAPGACSKCASIIASTAASEGKAAAVNAVAEAQTLGIGTGNPLYLDVEAYSRSSANSAMVLSYIEAWTEELHAYGYLAGAYSSDASGITDLASEAGTGYVEPDDIWFANWNNAANVQDSAAPTSVWPAGKRLHQYEGAHNASYDGATINIDADYIDGATAAAGGGAATAAALPTASTTPAVTGAPVKGVTLKVQHARWSGTPTSYAYRWQLCNSTQTTCATIKGATHSTYKVTAADVGHRVTVIEQAANAAGAGTQVTSSASGVVRRSSAGWLLYSRTGNVYNSQFEPFYGSPAASKVTLPSPIIGLAQSSAGYWLVAKNGKVYSYGNAAKLPALAAHSNVVGIVAAATGGYWLYTSSGHVYNSRHAHWYGSLPSVHVTNHSVVGMAATPDGHGYWLVTSGGRVYAFGDAAPKVAPSGAKAPIVGIAAASGRGYWLVGANGRIYCSRGVHFYGSIAANGIKTTSVVGIVPTSGHNGYWLVMSTGTVYKFGAAGRFPAVSVGKNVITGAA